MPSTPRFGARSCGVALRGATVLACGVLVLVGPRRLTAQDSPLVVEARGGVSVPVGAFANGSSAGEGTELGASFGVDIGLAGGGRWTPYVGFAQQRFPCEDAGCVAGGRYVATGFHAGLRFLPLPGARVLPWLGLGSVATHVEAGDLGPANAGPSDLGVGGELGAGLHIGASPIALSPAVRVTAVNMTLPDGARLRMRYVVADLAVVLSF